MRTVTLKIKDYEKCWNSQFMFVKIWLNEYLRSHADLQDITRLLYDDMRLAAEGFFMYYTTLIEGGFSPERELIKGMTREGIQLGQRDSRRVACKVPVQQPVPEIEAAIAEYWTYLNGLEITATSTDCIIRARTFKKSLTRAKLERLIRWGYRTAQALLPANEVNARTLRLFFAEFDHAPHAKFLSDHFESVVFEVEDGEHMKWDMFLLKADGERVHYKDIHKHLK